MKKLFVLLFCPMSFFAQLTITNGSTNTQLVNTLIGSGGSVSVSNISFSGVQNSSSRYQLGQFAAAGTVATNLGFTSGLILSTGNTSSIPLGMATDPRSNQISTNYVSCTASEVRKGGTCPQVINDLTVLSATNNYFNAAILEFDFVPSNTNISFRYVFGSEEYEDNSGFINYNCSSYNDKFAFLISGPGISGGQGYTSNARNIARLPNGSEVAINSVNNGVVGSSGGSPNETNCQAANPLWIENTPSTEFRGAINGISFNGNTRTLTAGQSGLTAGATYHIKIIIADLSDGAYDSGVFLEAGSFTSPVVLPITLKDFKADCFEKQVDLSWTSQSERNNDYYLLEKANEDGVFEAIANIQGAGTVSTEKTYTYADLDVNPGISYYKLSQVDYNGVKTVLKTLPFQNTCLGLDESTFNFSHNTEDQSIAISYFTNKNLNLNFQMYNQMGQVVIDEEVKLNENNQYLKVDLKRELEQGVYYIRLSNDQLNHATKIFIQK